MCALRSLYLLFVSFAPNALYGQQTEWTGKIQFEGTPQALAVEFTSEQRMPLEIYTVGDAVEPSKTLEVNREAFQVGLKI